MLHFNCPHCQTSMDVPETLGGRSGLCPNCHRSVRVPLPGEESQTPEPEVVLSKDALILPTPPEAPSPPQKPSSMAAVDAAASGGRKCGRCGESVPMEVAFCRGCGSYVPGNVTPADKPQATAQGRQKITLPKEDQVINTYTPMPSFGLMLAPVLAILLGLGGIFSIYLALGGLVLGVIGYLKFSSQDSNAKRWSLIGAGVSLAVVLVFGAIFAFSQVKVHQFTGEWVSVTDASETVKIEQQGTKNFLVYINDAEPIPGVMSPAGSLEMDNRFLNQRGIIEKDELVIYYDKASDRYRRK